MIQEIFRMLNQFAVEIPTLPVDQCHSHLIQFRKECQAFCKNAEPQRRAAKHLGHTWYVGKRVSLVNGEEVTSLSHAKVYVFSDSDLFLGKVNQNPTSNTAREQQLGWFKDSSQYRTLDTIDGEPMEFEWNIFLGFTTLQLVQEVQGRIIFMPMFNDIIW